MCSIGRFVKLRSGKRFYILHRYYRNRLPNIFILIFLLLFSGVWFLAGIIMLFIPGPGVLFIVLAFLPVVAISKKFARFLDKVEVNLKQGVEKVISQRNRKQ